MAFEEIRNANWLAHQIAIRDAALAGGAPTADAEVAGQATPQPAITPDEIRTGMGAVLKYVAPHKVLQKQKRYLCHHCRKPTDMKIRVYVNHIDRINDQELRYLPPQFNASQCLPEDEVIDIVVNNVP